MTDTNARLVVNALSVDLPDPARRDRWVRAVVDLDLTLTPGKITAVVGESGSGKSMIISALTGLLPPGARVMGEALFRHDDGDWIDLLTVPERVLARTVRGRLLGVIGQSAQTSFTPVRPIGAQLAETIRHTRPHEVIHPHGTGQRGEILADLIEVAGLTGVDLNRYPHQLSGGELRRASIAASLAGHPPVLLADEPTVGLDAALRDDLAIRIRDLTEHDHAVLLITHDLDLAATLSDEVIVLYAGQAVESGPTEAVLTDPLHDYTKALLAALPRNGLTAIPGLPPDLTGPARGCAYHQRVGPPCPGTPISRSGERRVACQPV